MRLQASCTLMPLFFGAGNANTGTLIKIKNQMEMLWYSRMDYKDVLSPKFESGLPPQAIKSQALTSISLAEGYGCWCNFGINGAQGQGKALDDFDKACKRLSENYICISEQFTESNQKCSPESVNYEPGNIYAKITEAVFAKMKGDLNEAERKTDDFRGYCETKNHYDPCQVQACVAEAFFLYEISPFYHYPSGSHPQAPKMVYHHRDENFSVEGYCQNSNNKQAHGSLLSIAQLRRLGQAGTGGIEGLGSASASALGDDQVVVSGPPQCCGSLPNFYRFTPTSENHHACCRSTGTVFNWNSQCCSDTGVKHRSSNEC